MVFMARSSWRHVVVLVRIKNAERASMNDVDVEPRLALIEILSDFRGKPLIAGRRNEKDTCPVFRRFAGAAPRAHFTHPRLPNRLTFQNLQVEVGDMYDPMRCSKTSFICSY